LDFLTALLVDGTSEDACAIKREAIRGDAYAGARFLTRAQESK